MDGSSFGRPGATAGDGLVIGTLAAIGSDGAVSVRFDLPDGRWTAPARAMLVLGTGDIGQPVVLLFENGDPERPVVLGRLQPPPAPAPKAADAPEVLLDGDRVELSAEREIVLRCGKASITLTRTGKIVLRGTYILSRSSGPNKIKGGSIQLN